MAKTRTGKKEPGVKRPKPVVVGFIDVRAQYLILVLLGLVLYANSFRNGYAFDDGIVIEKNSYVQEGLRGIPQIFKTDVYQSFYAQMNSEEQLSGGRYRPLSVAMFAVEQELFGSRENPRPENDVAAVRHVINVLLYLLTGVLMLHFLRRHVLPESPRVAFLASIIFLVHPLHTEVVANIKSRDEILSLLFIILTFTAVSQYRETGKPLRLVLSLLSYFLALLSKEYAVTLIVLIPLFLVIVRKESWANSIKVVLPFVVVFLVYLWLRITFVGLGRTQENIEVLNNPYLFASGPEKWATKCEVLLRYLKLLVLPYPLSSDYSYQAIPYTSFLDPMVWLSILLHLAMIAATIVLLIRKHIFAFALTFYLTNLSLVSNFVTDIGATMGERLIYHSSFGFALGIALLLDRALEKVAIGTRKTQVTIGLLFLLILPCGAIIIPRNAQWKSYTTLFIHDAEVMPNSALLNCNAGKAYLDLAERPENKANATELTTKSIPFSQKAVMIHQRYLNGYLNLGVAYFRLGELEKAEENWNVAREIYPDHPWVTGDLRVLARLYSVKAAESSSGSDRVRLLEKAVRADPVNAEIWFKLGEAYSTIGDFTRARSAWGKALQLKPDYKEAEERIRNQP